MGWNTKHCDKEHRISFDPAKQSNECSEVLQWTFGPMGQGVEQSSHTFKAIHFKMLAEKVPYEQKRCLDETIRLLGVLKLRLKDRSLEKNIASRISMLTLDVWRVEVHKLLGVETLDKYPGLKAWFEKVAAREGTKAGYAVPPNEGSHDLGPRKSSRKRVHIEVEPGGPPQRGKGVRTVESVRQTDDVPLNLRATGYSFRYPEFAKARRSGKIRRHLRGDALNKTELGMHQRIIRKFGRPRARTPEAESPTRTDNEEDGWD
ncbi:hypothetical protein C8R43DRAFT_954967 [Mycena crocata]|nr:hypothetical protein C8R43DRAFT_954967 [Mycena crocata]